LNRAWQPIGKCQLPGSADAALSRHHLRRGSHSSPPPSSGRLRADAPARPRYQSSAPPRHARLPVHPRSDPRRQPAANGQSVLASGKEVLAYGFRKYRIGEVIGTQTEGAVLAATAFLIGRGILLLAVEDVQVDGARLEGVGVAPTIEVQAGPTSAGAADPQLSRAVALLTACSRSSYARRHGRR